MTHLPFPTGFPGQPRHALDNGGAVRGDLTLEEFRGKCSVGIVLLMQRRELKEKKAKGRRRLDDDEGDVEDP